LIEIEGFALRHSFDLGDIDEDDISEFLAGRPVGRGGPDIACADNADFCPSHFKKPF
jgi:hypothetical protein